jgi:hypothetical protein
MVVLTSGHLFSTPFMNEQQADQFACETAKSRLELEAARDVLLVASTQSLLFPEFGNAAEALDYAAKLSQQDRERLLGNDWHDKGHLEHDPIHPAPRARAENIQKCLDKWDAEHKA